VLQYAAVYVAVCVAVLVAVTSSVLQCVAVCVTVCCGVGCSDLQCDAVYYSVMQSVLQCVLQCVWFRLCTKQDAISLPSTPPQLSVDFWFCKRALFCRLKRGLDGYSDKSSNCIHSKEPYVYRALDQQRKHLYPPHRRDTFPHLRHLWVLFLLEQSPHTCVCDGSFICAP